MTARKAAKTVGKRSVRDEHRELTKRRLVDATLEVLGRKGYRATTVDDIATCADVARATFYLHFKNKLEVARFLTDEMSAAAVQRCQELDDLLTKQSKSATREALKRWIPEVFQFFDENRTIVLLWQELFMSEPEFDITDTTTTVADQMPRYLSRWSDERLDEARLRIALLFQLLARTYLLTRIRDELPGSEELLIDVLAEIWTTTAQPPKKSSASP